MKGIFLLWPDNINCLNSYWLTKIIEKRITHRSRLIHVGLLQQLTNHYLGDILTLRIYMPNSIHI